MSGTQGGRYVLCDRCKVSTFSLNLPWPHDGKTIRAAEAAGWRIDTLKGPHICPACVANNEVTNRDNQS